MSWSWEILRLSSSTPKIINFDPYEDFVIKIDPIPVANQNQQQMPRNNQSQIQAFHYEQRTLNNNRQVVQSHSQRVYDLDNLEPNRVCQVLVSFKAVEAIEALNTIPVPQG
ncbi:5763_t:CDS:1, partial [Racocetra persica]